MWTKPEETAPHSHSYYVTLASPFGIFQIRWTVGSHGPSLFSVYNIELSGNTKIHQEDSLEKAKEYVSKLIEFTYSKYGEFMEQLHKTEKTNK